MALSSEIQGFISGASAAYPHASTNYLSTVANIESSGDTFARNGDAQGLFQFTSPTAAQYGLTNRYDPRGSSYAAAHLASDNYNGLVNGGISNPTDADLYLAHQQGVGGALALLNNPNANAASLLGTDAVVKNGGNTSMTASQFADLWRNKYNAAAGNPSSTSSTSGASGSTSSSSSSPLDVVGNAENFLGNYFVRIAGLAVGLIFVGIGLSMFKTTAPLVHTVTSAAKKTAAVGAAVV